MHKENPQDHHTADNGNAALGVVSKRFFVCEDINYLNEMKVISTEFNSWKDAYSFRQTMKEGQLYKDKTLLIINVC